MKAVFMTTNIFLIASALVNAQSLPNKQEISLRAPASIKIDGKATEWDNKFQAYNHATDVYYTVCNDDDNIYFVVRATKPRIIEKIMNVGITVTINNKGEKRENAPENIVVNYPLMVYSFVPRIVTDAGAKTVNIMVATGPTTRAVYKPEFDVKPSDSLKDVANKLLNEAAKTIKVKGINEVPDGELSVYNELNIRVGAAFDHSGAYTYELALPLKILGLSVNEAKKISYNIMLQSRLNVLRRGMVTRYSTITATQVDMDQDLDGTTDMWADYTLAKKP